MKEFLVGLIFLLAAMVLAGLGMLLFPLIIVFDFFLKLILVAIFIIFSIWLLGKFIILIWEKLSSRR